jgi:Prokaryotic dksA/traR C4-type zinc finger.
MIDLFSSHDHMVKCCKCGKKISAEEAVKIDGQLYCRECAQDEKDWRFIEMMESIGNK